MSVVAHSAYEMPGLLGTAVEVTGVALVALLAYTFIGMLFGCPYCGLPDMAWPHTLLRWVTGR